MLTACAFISIVHFATEQVAVVRTDEHRCLSFTIERLQIDNQLSTALYPPLLRARPLAAMTTNSSSSSASSNASASSSNRIVLDGLPSRPANNPPSIHFYTKRLCTAASRYVDSTHCIHILCAKHEVRVHNRLHELLTTVSAAQHPSGVCCIAA